MQKNSDEYLERHGYKREGSIYKIIKPNDEKIAVFCLFGFGITWLSHFFADRLPFKYNNSIDI